MTVPPPPDRRVRLPRAERRAQLLGAALEAFAESGYHACAMDDIAERAGVSKPVLYQHFSSKLDLYLAIAESVSDEVVRTIDTVLETAEGNHDRIAGCLSSFFEFAARPASGFSVLFQSDMGSDPEVAAILDRTRQACGESMGRVLAEETDLAWDECVLLGTAMAGMAQAAAVSWYARRDTLPRERVLELLSTIAWRGWGAVPPRAGASVHPG
ncbi:TetR/AcrR family transcriptional regulator [Serinicoccus kebangsaanensis]|uniref:TetR/AcrR family transcriptional regulator n=1 Tax=Serinicoccus kebangsaanensis TaxID=2602069 RepID=UPI00124C82D6|nr:TetR/AcrR family transcriptional regulator [Serinicoccus kebangsaanensis]